MPLYNTYTDDTRVKARPVSANSEPEAIGKARERWHIPDNENCYAIAQDESEITQDTVKLAEAVHFAMLKVFTYRDYARRKRYTGLATQLTSVYDTMSSAYFLLTASVARPEPKRVYRRKRNDARTA